jgi:hypothetical protein
MYNIKITQCLAGLGWIDIITIETDAASDTHTKATGELERLTKLISRSDHFHLTTLKGESVIVTPSSGPIKLELVKFK